MTASNGHRTVYHHTRLDISDEMTKMRKTIPKVLNSSDSELGRVAAAHFGEFIGDEA
jgi:hypothetical protein